MHPILHNSTLVVYTSFPNNISGALYHNETTSFLNVFIGNPNPLANPKSAIFKTFVSDINKFSLFISL